MGYVTGGGRLLRHLDTHLGMEICMYRYAMSSTKDESINTRHPLKYFLLTCIALALSFLNPHSQTHTARHAELHTQASPIGPNSLSSSQLPNPYGSPSAQPSPTQPNEPPAPQTHLLPPPAIGRLQIPSRTFPRGTKLIHPGRSPVSLRQSAFRPVMSHFCALLCCGQTPTFT